MVSLTYINKRYEAVVDALQFGLILLVGVLQMLERASRVDIVARIDAHLFTILCSHVGHTGVEVDVGHKRLLVAVGLQSGRDVLHVLSLTHALGSQSDQFAASINDALGLRHASLRIVGVGGGHRLYADGVLSAYLDVAHAGNTANSS